VAAEAFHLDMCGAASVATERRSRANYNPPSIAILKGSEAVSSANTVLPQLAGYLVDQVVILLRDHRMLHPAMAEELPTV